MFHALFYELWIQQWTGKKVSILIKLPIQWRQTIFIKIVKIYFNRSKAEWTLVTEEKEELVLDRVRESFSEEVTFWWELKWILTFTVCIVSFMTIPKAGTLMLQMRKLRLKLVKRPAQVYECHAQVTALQPMVLFPLHKGIKKPALVSYARGM